MKIEDNAEKFIENQYKLSKNSNKLIPRFLVYLNKIYSVSQYDEYVKKINIELLEWSIEYLIIKPFLLFFCLSALRLSSPLNNFLSAEGISIFWFLLVELKKELWSVK